MYINVINAIVDCGDCEAGALEPLVALLKEEAIGPVYRCFIL